MNHETTQKEREYIVSALNSGKTTYLGIVETDEGELHIIEWADYVFAGTACNVGLLVQWDLVAKFGDLDQSSTVWFDTFENEVSLSF